MKIATVINNQKYVYSSIPSKQKNSNKRMTIKAQTKEIECSKIDTTMEARTKMEILRTATKYNKPRVFTSIFIDTVMPC